VRWFRSHAADLGIDPDRISAGGYSAGAVTALWAATAGPIGVDSDATVPWDIAAAVSFAGAALTSVGPSAPPALFFHGDEDPRVWYDEEAGPFLPGFSAVSHCARLRAAGRTCIFHTHAGAGHNLSAFRPDDLDATAGFLSCQVGAPSPFTDTGGRWYEDAASWAAREQLVTGFGDGGFRGKDPLTRGQYVNLIWKLLGQPAGSAAHGFPDVPVGAAYHAALDWAREAGVIDGFPDGTFRGGNTVPRGQAVAILWKALGAVDGAPRAPFSDVPPSRWYAAAVDWAAHHGVMSGFPDLSFRPTEAINRGQTVAMVRDAAGEAAAWAPAQQAAPPTSVCFRVGDPEQLAG
jgi:hypothetical protein